MRTFALLGAKNFGVFEIYGVFARTHEKRELSQCGYFVAKGERGRFFAMCGRLIWTPLTRKIKALGVAMKNRQIGTLHF